MTRRILLFAFTLVFLSAGRLFAQTGCRIDLGIVTPTVCVGSAVCIPYSISPGGCVSTSSLILELSRPLPSPTSSCNFSVLSLDTVGSCFRVPLNFAKGRYCVRLRSGNIVSDVKSFDIDTIDYSPPPNLTIVQLPPIRPSYCKGDTVKFKIIGIENGGVGYSLQWSKNDTARDGATDSVFTFTGLNDGDFVFASVTKQNKCALNATGRSISIPISVNKPPVISVKLRPGSSGCESTINSFVSNLSAVGIDPYVIWTRSTSSRTDTLSQGINDTLFTLSPADSARFGDTIRATVVTGRCKLTDNSFYVIRACGEVFIDPPLDLGVCAGATMKVPYTIVGSFQTNNFFSVQLSDSTGSFQSPVQIGTYVSTKADTIPVIIPADLRGGDCFRVRIIASLPADTSDTSACFKVFPKPLKPLTVNDSVCASGEVTLLASSTETNVNFNWYTSPFNQELIFTGSSRTFTIQADSVYFVSAVSVNGCESDRSEVKAVSNSATPVEVGANQSFCIGAQTFQLNPSISGGVWTGDLAVINGQVDLTGVAVGDYVLQYASTNSLGCIATDSLTISVKPIPQANAGPDLNACSNQNVIQLSGLPTGGVWLGDNVLSDGTYNPALSVDFADTLIYSITENGCIGFDTLAVVVSPAPSEFTISTSNPSSCAVDDGSATLSGITLNPSWKVKWSVNTADSSAFPTLSGLGGGTYEVIIKDTLTGCNRSEFFSLSDPEVPAPVISGLLPSYCTNDSCLIISVLPTSPSGIWNGPGVSVLPNGDVKFCPATAGQGTISISYQYDNSSGCVGATSTNVQVNSAPNVNAGFFTDTLCSDDSPVQLEGFSPLAPPAVWTPQPIVSATGLFNPALAAIGENELTLTITANGCTSTATRLMQVSSKPNPVITRLPLVDVCFGENVTLTANPGSGVIAKRFEWFKDNVVIPNENGAQISVSQAGSYVVVVEGAGNCSGSSAAFSVQFNALPPDTITVSGSLEPCSNNLSTLIGPSGTGLTYQWFLGADSISGANSSTFVPSESGQYSVKVTNGNGCKSVSDFVNMDIKQAPLAPAIAPAADTCLQAGQPITIILGATGTGLSYQWFKQGTPNILLAGKTESSLDNIIQAGKYFAVVSSSNGCVTNSDTINIAQTISISVQDTVIFRCLGEEPFQVTGFSPGGCPLLYNGQVLNNNLWDPNAEGDFVLTYECTNSNGCISRKNITIRVSPNPAANIVVLGATNVCQGDSVLLQINNGNETGFSYTLYRNGQPFGLPFLQPNIWVNQTGNYQVEVKFNRCNVFSNTLSINFRKVPLARAGNDLSVCGNLISNFNNQAGITAGSWSGSERITTSGDYNASGFIGCETLTLTVDSANGCSATDTIEVCIKPQPDFQTNSLDASNCAVSDGKAWVENPSSGTTFSWTKTGSANVISTSDSILNVLPGVYTVRITTDSNSCFIDRTAIINSPNNLSVFIGGLPDSVCFGSEPIQLSGTPADSGQFTSFGNRIVDGTVFDPSIPGPMVDTVYYTVSLNGCVGTSRKTIKLNPLPVVDAGSDSRVCFGDTLILKAVQPTGVPLVWIGSQVNNDSLFVANNSNVASVLVTINYTKNGCSNSDSRLVFIDTLPQFNVVPTDVSSCGSCDGSAVREMGNTSQFQTIWRDLLSGSIIGTGGVVTNRCVGLYSVEVIRNTSGCRKIETFGISGPTNIVPFECLQNVPDGLCQNEAPVTLGKCNPDAKIFVSGVQTNIIDPAALLPGNATILLSLTDSAGCTGVEQKFVPIRQVPIVNVAGVGPVFACTNQTSLQLSGFFPPYDPSVPENGWTAAGAPAGFISKSGIINPSLVSGDAQFVLTYTSKTGGVNGCSESKTKLFKVYKTPSAAITPSTGPITICTGTQAVLSADPVTPGYTYTWLFGTTNPLPIGFQSQYSASLTGLYSLKVNNNGCLSQNFSSIQVQVTPSPVIASIGADTIICKAGGIVNLPSPNVIGTTNFAQWQAVTPVPAGFITSFGTVNPGLVDAGSYVVRYVAGQGPCIDTAFRTITVLPNKTTTISGPTSIEACEGQFTALVADSSGPGIGYLWFKDGIAIPNSNNDSLTVTSSGEYRVKILINGSGVCSAISSDFVIVLVKPSPTVSISGVQNPKICYPSAPYNVATASPYSPADAIWTSSVPGLISGNGLVSPSSLTADGNYDLILTKTIGNCSASDTIKLSAFRTPDASFNSSALAICQGEQILLTYNNPNNYNTTWSKDNSLIAVNVDSLTINTAGIYKLRVENDICSAESSTNFAVQPKPEFGLRGDTSVCKNTQTLQFFPSNPTAGTGVWTGPGITESGTWNPSLVEAGLIDITYALKSEFGCITSKSFKIEVGALPDVQVSSSLDTVEVNAPVTISASGGVAFEWSPSAGLNITNGPSVIAKLPETRIYKVKVTSDKGCVAEKSIEIIVDQEFKIYDAFSPNGDFKNDVWYIKNILRYPSAKVYIFNRWGNQVFESEPGYPNPWNGTFNADPVPPGVYFYTIDLGQGLTPKSGSITVIR